MSKTISTPQPTSEAAGPLASEFQGLVATFGPALRRLIGVYELDGALQEDLLQDVLVALWRGLARFRGESKLATWVYRVAHNVALKHRRTQGRARARQAEYERDQASRDLGHAEVSSDSSEEHVAIDALRRRIAALPALDRELVVLHLEGMGRTEIAEIVGLSTTNVSTRLARVRAKLKRALGENEASPAAEAKS